MTDNTTWDNRHKLIEELFDKWNEEEEDTISVSDETSCSECEPVRFDNEENVTGERPHPAVIGMNCIKSGYKVETNNATRPIYALGNGNHSFYDEKDLIDLNDNEGDQDSLQCRDPVYDDKIDSLLYNLKVIISRSFENINTKEWVKQYKQQQHGSPRSYSTS